MPVKKLTLMAILTAIALIIFIVEAQIPLPVPLPGFKLGIANSVTLFALFYGAKSSGVKAATESPEDKRCSKTKTSAKEPLDTKKSNRVARLMPETLSTANAFTILICRIVLGAIFIGRPVALIYSLAGGLLGFAALIAVKRLISNKQIWVCGAIGAVFHNIGQIAAAVLITGTPAIALYLPVLIVAGVLTGVFTGFVAQFTLQRLENR